MSEQETCQHKGSCEQFWDHTAKMIVAVATAAHPGDPQAAAEMALAAVEWTASLADRPMDTSDLDPETGEPYGVVPDGEVWVETESTRDDDGRVAFTAWWPDGAERLYHMRLSEFSRWIRPYTVKVLTSQQAQAFHASRTEVAT